MTDRHFTTASHDVRRSIVPEAAPAAVFGHEVDNGGVMLPKQLAIRVFPSFTDVALLGYYGRAEVQHKPARKSEDS